MGQFRQLLVHQNIHFLKQNKLRLVALSLVAATFSNLSLPLGTILAGSRGLTNHNKNVSTTEVKNALQTVSGVLSSSDQVATKSDSDSALTATTNDTAIDIPKDADRGVTFGTEGQNKLSIELPGADSAALAKQAAPGVVTYDSGNGSANAIQPTEDGGLRMLTVIDNPNAPTEYDYKVTVPNGGRIMLAVDGGAVVVGANKKVMFTIDKPWAKDAKGNAIQTYFTADGKTLTQHVKHNVPGVVYPIIADPRISRSWHGITVWFNRGDMRWISETSGAAAALGAARFPQAAAIAGTVSFLANQASRRGYCLAIYRSYWLGAPLVAWVYKC
ncbi:MAG TPA: hypothetical protein VK674_05795 [Candidatus Limnocylindria bacterium]|nr:hypothetical protein [Candidatus Limnocylindria bacterium]